MSTTTLKARFPDIELSYGGLLHKKVHCDMYQVLPKGKKCILWYTYDDCENICYMLSFGRNGSISQITKIITSFSSELCYGKGTILSGVIFSTNNISCYTVLDIHYYKGQDISKSRYIHKYQYIKALLSNETNNDVFLKDQVIVGCPVLVETFKEAIDHARSLPYDVYGIGCIQLSYSKCKGVIQYTDKSDPIAYFRVKPQIRCDIYSLLVSDDKKPHGIAAITDYKSSVMMNSLFRNIKENRNLDLLEESDDEEEFEDISEDKYVDLKKSFVMKCVFVPRFRKWKPLEVIKNGKASSKKDIIMLEKKSQDNIYVKRSSSRRFRKSK
tara:strand:- start:882 stop:1862 length:981 start_codon:yes stop_codon:yes gene_type:complete